MKNVCFFLLIHFKSILNNKKGHKSQIARLMFMSLQYKCEGNNCTNKWFQHSYIIGVYKISLTVLLGKL